MGIPDHLTCLLRHLYAGQEPTVRTGHGTIDWFQIGKGVHQGCILSPCLFNLYAEYIMEKAMAPHSSTLAWKIPRTEEPGGLQHTGCSPHGVAESDTTVRLHCHFLSPTMATRWPNKNMNSWAFTLSPSWIRGGEQRGWHGSEA